VSAMNKGLQRIGIVGLSTLVATTAMTGVAATTYAAAGDYAAGSVLEVAQGQAAAPAGSLSLEFANSWTTGATQTFTVGSNDCSTAAGISAAIGFSALPTVTVTDPAPANSGTDTTPTFAPPVALGSSSTACDLAGIKDKVTLTQVAPSTGVVTDTWLATLSVVRYNVGATTPKGNINVATAGSFKASGSVLNAVIPIASFTNTARVAALPSATAVSLGTQSFDETTAGAFFATGTTTVVLTPSAGTFTAGVTPTVTVPAGYTKTNPVTAAPGTYSFTVTAPATTVAASVTVSGLTITAPGSAQTVTLDALVGAKNVDAVPVVNVVKYDARTGGATRYETAAALFNTFGSVDNAVLSSGALFPDALSANYLAGRLHTGTLLTTPATLSNAARQSIITAGVKTVYITGETGAVSQTVQDQIEAMHVGNVPAAAFISVVRLGGSDRFATNKLINEHTFLASNTVLLASGTNFPDALALGPVAYHKTFPLILTRGTTLGASENSQLSDFHPTNVVIAGGTGVVSQAIEDSLTAQGFTVLRLAGLDRTQTAAAVATWATVGIAPSTGIKAAQGFISKTTYVSTGDNFADALAAGPVAGASNQMIVLSSSPTLLGAGIPSYLGHKAVGTTDATVGTLHALGLSGAVSTGLMQAAAVTIGSAL